MASKPTIPAFPTIEQNFETLVWLTTDGMTLRDYFASKVIPQVTSKPKSIIHWFKWFLGLEYQSSYPK